MSCKRGNSDLPDHVDDIEAVRIMAGRYLYSMIVCCLPSQRFL